MTEVTRSLILISLSLFLFAALLGCDSGSSGSSAKPRAESDTTTTAPTATGTAPLTATAVPVPTDADSPGPTATATFAPAATAVPAPTAIDTPEPTVTPTATPKPVQPVNETDREALGALYHATDGPDWVNSDNWLSDKPLGEWYGVMTDDLGRVTELRLENNRVGGELPPELGQLSNLEELNLTDNELVGEIPVELGQLSKLTLLLLNDNDLTGEIPPDLGQLSNLTHLRLARNDLGGRIPSALGQLSNLVALDLDYNELTGAIPAELGRLSNLEELVLNDNDLSGAIPAELGQLSSLVELFLHGNDFSGCVPEALGGTPDNDFDELRLPFCVNGAVPEPTATPEGTSTSMPTQTTITSPQVYNGNVFVLPVAEDLVIRSWDLPLAEYTARFYEYFNDEFDFLVFVANVPSDRIREAGIDHGAYYIDIRNDVQGIGKPIFADGQTWGNTEELQGLVYINTYDHQWGGDFVNGVLLHELIHRWANFVVPPYEHWGFVDQPCILDGYDISTLIDHGDGKFSHEFSGPSYTFCPLELYLAGFIPAEEVPDFRIAVNAGWVFDERGYVIEDEHGYRVFTASGFEMYTIDDIIAEHGPRVPDFSRSQKDFRAAVVLLISTDYPPTLAILDRLSYDVTWFSHMGDHEMLQEEKNFYQATGGRGTITMGGLSQFLKDKDTP